MTEVPDAAAKAAALLAELSAAEKIAFLHQHQPAVERLGLAAFHTGCEALHGVAWIGRATVFPQAVGLGATWDRALLRRVGRGRLHRGAGLPPGHRERLPEPAAWPRSTRWSRSTSGRRW